MRSTGVSRRAACAHRARARSGVPREEGSSSREIARHYELGGDGERSAGWYLTARANPQPCTRTAIRSISPAARSRSELPPAVRTALLDVREKARGRRGDRAGQREDIEALDRLAGDDPAAKFDVLKRAVQLARTLGESDEEGRLIAAMDEVAELLGDAARAQALAERATHAGLRSRPAEALAPARAALALFEHLGDVRSQLDCLFLLVDYTLNVGDIDASRVYLAQMHARVSSLTDRAVEARALAVAATAALLRQEYRECFELTSRALELNVATADREAEAASRGRLAVTAAWLTDFGTALREFDLALKTYESIGHKRGIAITYTNRTPLPMRLGLFEEALKSIEGSNAYFATVHEQRTIVANGVNASFVNLQLGNARTAKELAESALRAAKEIGFPVFEAAALANLGNAERALAEYDAAIGHITAGIDLRRPIQDPRDFADDLADLTLAYVAAGRGSEALRTAQELQSIGETAFDGALWPQYAWWAIAQGLAAGGAADRSNRSPREGPRGIAAVCRANRRPPCPPAFLSVPVNVRIAGGAGRST